MRLKLLLHSTGTQFIAANYFYPLSAAIYKLLRFGSPEFSDFLHSTGYRLNGKKYKLFNFSLHFNRYRINKNIIQLLSPDACLLISSPLIEDFITNFVTGTFESEKIEIFADNTRTTFQVLSVESLPQFEIKEQMNFKLLSPMVLSTVRECNGKLAPYYYRYNDDLQEINRVLNDNLRNKYELIYNYSSNGKTVNFIWDKSYIERIEQKGKRITKKQTIKQGHKEETEVIGNMAPFHISGDIDLIKTGYETGFGNMNSMGFGMVDTGSAD